MKTTIISKKDIKPQWFLIDAKDLILGRTASKTTTLLQGKSKPSYTPHLDNGDYVIIINAKKAVLSGNKEDEKTYFSHSTYAGGGKTITYKQALEKREGTFPMQQAVKRMLPKTKLGRQMFKKLFVYAGETHPHNAQNTTQIKI